MINWGAIYSEIPNFLVGAGYTVAISLGAVCIGIVLGLINAMLRLSRRWWLYYPATVYLEAFRNTPMLLQIYFLYYGLFPEIGLNNIQEIYVGILALGLNSGAYLGEIFRGGIQSIDRGQREAALSLGMSETQAMRYVVLPQALTNALPALGNEFVTLIKDSSLVSVLGVTEMMQQAYLGGGRNFEYFSTLLGVGIIYFAMCFSLSRYLASMEKKMRAGYK